MPYKHVTSVRLIIGLLCVRVQTATGNQIGVKTKMLPNMQVVPALDIAKAMRISL